ncbi:hypothetical protein Tsp_01784 [Trichinella spiralis]|uniref:hypothetical protein n=1 Tax=Trichinella spiralis TaxID=6334 RepID=UPI0001EFCC98|nr:hypothetical protein Tsp_01784 [Trichinella spiralis]
MTADDALQIASSTTQRPCTRTPVLPPSLLTVASPSSASLSGGIELLARSASATMFLLSTRFEFALNKRCEQSTGSELGAFQALGHTFLSRVGQQLGVVYEIFKLKRLAWRDRRNTQGKIAILFEVVGCEQGPVTRSIGRDLPTV